MLDGEAAAVHPPQQAGVPGSSSAMDSPSTARVAEVVASRTILPFNAEDLWRLIPKPQPGAGPLAETDPRSAERHRHLGPAHIVDPGERQFQDGPVQGR